MKKGGICFSWEAREGCTNVIAFQGTIIRYTGLHWTEWEERKMEKEFRLWEQTDKKVQKIQGVMEDVL